MGWRSDLFPSSRSFSFQASVGAGRISASACSCGMRETTPCPNATACTTLIQHYQHWRMTTSLSEICSFP